MNLQSLAESQAEVYWLHDAVDFQGLADTAASIYMQLGIDRSKAQEAGSRISEAYRLADEAEQAMKANEPYEEIRIYNLAKQKLEEAETLLEFPDTVAEYQINWWMYFRHKKILKVLRNIYLQHKPKNKINIIDTMFLCFYLAKVGFAHNKRSKEQAIFYANKYWKILMKRNTNGYPFLG
jgi:hypothetical protein